MAQEARYEKIGIAALRSIRVVYAKPLFCLSDASGFPRGSVRMWRARPGLTTTMAYDKIHSRLAWSRESLTNHSTQRVRGIDPAAPRARPPWAWPSVARVGGGKVV
jgi:hypothetical protein